MVLKKNIQIEAKFMVFKNLPDFLAIFEGRQVQDDNIFKIPTETYNKGPEAGMAY